jgi:hypothetical protein
LLTGGLIVLVFLLSLYRTRLVEAQRRNASLLLIRETRFYKAALVFVRKIMKVAKPEDRIKLAMNLPSFVPKVCDDQDAEHTPLTGERYARPSLGLLEHRCRHGSIAS